MEPVRYPLMEHFYTIQGEGANTGKAAYFLRLGGCDVGCVWCDVKESWDASVHPQAEVGQIVQWVVDAGARIAVVTGGEPCMYDLQPLTDALSSAGIETFLESSGAYPVTGDWNWICISPKKFKGPLAESLTKADELKVVVYNRHDLEWAEQHASAVLAGCQLFLQPEYSVLHKMAPVIVEYVKHNPQWRISLQTHKILNIP